MLTPERQQTHDNNTNMLQSSMQKRLRVQGYKCIVIVVVVVVVLHHKGLKMKVGLSPLC